MMTRRSVLSLLAMLPGLANLATAAPASKVAGPMSLDRERMLAARGVKVSVFVDGVDVTNRCQYADDTPGHQIARLLKRNRDGRLYVDRTTGEVARETVTGDVVITLTPKHGQ